MSTALCLRQSRKPLNQFHARQRRARRQYQPGVDSNQGDRAIARIAARGRCASAHRCASPRWRPKTRRTSQQTVSASSAGATMMPAMGPAPTPPADGAESMHRLLPDALDLVATVIATSPLALEPSFHAYDGLAEAVEAFRLVSMIFADTRRWCSSSRRRVWRWAPSLSVCADRHGPGRVQLSDAGRGWPLCWSCSHQRYGPRV
ncbi:MAG: transfer and pilus assembly protein TraG [Bradyrhizobium sp.]|nr:transfer and pilus assembly protein TraG [Bradyrhizobium sp.]